MNDNRIFNGIDLESHVCVKVADVDPPRSRYQNLADAQRGFAATFWASWPGRRIEGLAYALNDWLIRRKGRH